MIFGAAGSSMGGRQARYSALDAEKTHPAGADGGALLHCDLSPTALSANTTARGYRCRPKKG